MVMEGLKDKWRMIDTFMPLLKAVLKRTMTSVNWYSIIVYTMLTAIVVQLIAYAGFTWVSQMVYVAYIIAMVPVIILYGERLFPDTFRPRKRTGERPMENYVKLDKSDGIIPETRSGNEHQMN